MLMFRAPLQSCAWAGDVRPTTRTAAAAAATSPSAFLTRDADILCASFEVFANLLAAQGFRCLLAYCLPTRSVKNFLGLPGKGGPVLYPARPSSVSLYEHTTRF